MTRRILASGFLRTAANLAGRGAGAGRPALADLRRATSTAYYALFHQISRHGAFDFLPSGTEGDFAEIARWYTHTGVLSASGFVVEGAGPKPLGSINRADRPGVMSLRAATGSTIPADLLLVADAFRSLQEARHLADYDGNYDPVRAVTINHVQDAEAAVRATWSMWRAGESPRSDRRQLHAGYRCFLRLALLRSGGPKTR